MFTVFVSVAPGDFEAKKFDNLEAAEDEYDFWERTGMYVELASDKGILKVSMEGE